MVIFGGAGTLTGPLVGAPVLTFLPELLQRFVDFRLIIYGGMIVATLYALPLGIVGTLFRRADRRCRNTRRRRSGRCTAARDPRHAPSGETAPARLPIVDDARTCSMAFGGVRAINGVSLSVERRRGARADRAERRGQDGAAQYPVRATIRRPQGIVRIGGKADHRAAASHRVARLGHRAHVPDAQLFGDAHGAAERPGRLSGPDRRRRLLDSAASARRACGARRPSRREAACELLRFVGYAGGP